MNKIINETILGANNNERITIVLLTLELVEQDLITRRDDESISENKRKKYNSQAIQLFELRKQLTAFDEDLDP